jgi:diguanylate cyclase (GGDEF)-like protein
MEAVMKFFTRKNMMLAIWTLIAIVSMYSISNIPKLGPVLNFGSFVLPVVSAQGIIAAILSLCCILLVFFDYKLGSRIAFILMGFSTVTACIPIFMIHNLAPLPGVITMLVSLITVIIISSFYKKSTISSLTDYITGLPNRRYYVKYVNEKLEAKDSFYVAYIEIEDFKTINDVYGIKASDYILKETAPKLKGIISKNEMLFKITGGLFAMVLEEDSFPEEKLRLTIRSEVMMIPSNYGEDPSVKKSCTVSLAAGVVHINKEYKKERNAASILRDAEIALAKARKSPMQKIVLYDESLLTPDIEQQKAEYLIKDAMEHDWFFLVYQPQYITEGKKLRGFETLIRCRKPDGSIVSPATFIPAAEKTNLITEIDDYVLRRAMTEMKPVLEASGKNFIVSINVSAKNIATENFAQKINQLIEEIQFPAENLEIEITEYSFAESRDTTIDNILTLRTLGVQIALDDFGTGYTSIAQLMKLPVNLLKIDKSLIDELESDPVMSDMVDSIIYMGHIMDCEVISEGVENENQLEILKEHKCDFIQGFVWGKPLPYEEAKALLN